MGAHLTSRKSRDAAVQAMLSLILFAAGLFPGLLLSALYMLVVHVVLRVRPGWAPEPEPLGFAARVAELRHVWEFLALFALVVGGIYGGVFTPTEAAGAACIYAIVISMFVYREMSLADLWQITLDSAAPARLEIFDLAGRRVASCEVRGPGPGRVAVAAGHPLSAGVYTLRLSQASRALSARGVVMR